MSRLLLALILLLVPCGAWAACPTPLTVKDASGTTQNISTTDDPSGNCLSNVNSQLTATLTSPTSTLTRPANTTAYAGTYVTPQLVGSSATAGSVVVPSFSIATSGGTAAIPLMTLRTNATTGWGAVGLLITLWTTAPTYSTGDGATYTVATGSLFQRAQYSCTLVQLGDGATCTAVPVAGSAPIITPAATTLVYWDIEIQSAPTPISAQTFILTPQVWN